MPAYLPDINILLALAFEAHAHHVVAARWVADVAECRVCRITQSGFLHLASNPILFGDERFSFASEPLGLEHLWRRLSTTETYSPKVWMDRYLAALAIADGLTLATFDTGFTSVPDLNVETLAPDSGEDSATGRSP